MELDSVPYSALTRISEEGQEQSQRVFRQTQLGMAEPRRQTSVRKVSGRGVQDSAGQQANPRGLVRKPDCKQPLFEKDSIRRNLQKDLPDRSSAHGARGPQRPQIKTENATIGSLALRSTSTFPGSPTCRQQTVGHLSFHNIGANSYSKSLLDICVCMF